MTPEKISVQNVPMSNATATALLAKSFVTAAASGAKVNGVANLGDVVVYADTMNPGTAYVVTALPAALRFGGDTGYSLEPVVDSARGPRQSDLRQGGWRFAYRAV